MAEKRERQGGGSSNAPEAGADRSLYLTEVVCAEIGQFPPFDVAPYEFGRIEIGRVAGQAFNGQPRALRLQVRRHGAALDRKSTRLNSSHLVISYAVFCLKKKKKLTTKSSMPPDMCHL